MHLNRLLNTRQHTFGAASGSFMGNWTQSNTNTTDNYAETFRYDANGNILQLNRNGNSQHPGGQAMDRLNYTYRDGTNQLWSVQDGIAAGAYAGDIDNQGGSNYSYDRIGNLIGDVSENISQVNWTVYGKIGNIQKKQAFLGYVYNAGGERVVKQYLPYATNQCLGCDENTGMVDLEVYERNSNTPNIYKASKTITFLSEYTDVRYTEYTAIIEAGLALCTPQCNIQPPLTTSDADIYIRDATGNVLAVYHYDRKTAQLRWSEQHLYGSSRLGMYQPEKVVTSVSTDSKQREVGYLGKQIFELSNHLGNILATITDKKLQVSTNTTSTDYFEADVQTVQDYYAFGMQMPGRKLSGGYRYGFNGKENDNEVKGEGNQQDYGMRIYDGRIGKFLSVDPLTRKYPMLTPYQFASNSPIQALDIDGLEGVQYLETQSDKDGKAVIKRVVEADVYVAISRDKNSPHYYSKKPSDDLKVQGQVIGDLKSQFLDNKFKDDVGNDVIWRFNVNTFEVDADGGIETKFTELKNNPAFKVTPEGGGSFQYRGFILQRQLINPEVIPTEPGSEGEKEEGNLSRGIVVTINSQFYDERTQRPHTTSHETTHFFLRLHPNRAIRDPDNTPEGHAGAGGGILNYGTVQFRFPGQVRSSPNEKTTVSFEGIKPLNQTNVTNILQSVPLKPESPRQ